MTKDQQIQNILMEFAGQPVTDRVLNKVCDRLVELGGTDVSVGADGDDIVARLTIAGESYEATLSGSKRTADKPVEKAVEVAIEGKNTGGDVGGL